MANKIFTWDQPQRIINAFEDGAFSKSSSLSSGHHHASVYTLSDYVGDGYLELHVVEPDMSLCIFNCSWNEETVIDIMDGDRIRLNFSLDLDVLIGLSEEDEMVVNQPSWRIVNNVCNDVAHETYLSESKTIWVTIAITPDYIRNHFGEDMFADNAELEKLVVKSNQASTYREFPLDHRLSRIVSNIVSSHLHEKVHLNYVRCKATELICLAMDIMLESEKSTILPIRLGARDHKAINLAKEIIVSNLGQTPSVKEICQMIGMNRNKLHYGFKAIYGMPISKYLQEERLFEAYRQLEHTDQSILQVAVNVGFGHQSSFSTAFRKKYGFSPHQVRAPK